MHNVLGLRCVRCRTEYSEFKSFKGCPLCLAAGVPSNLEVVYDYQQIAATYNPASNSVGPASMWRYAALLPPEENSIVSIGEGMTPLLPTPTVAAEFGLKNLFVKEEGRNATWSFKSRLASCAVSSAKELGAEVVVGSSSGNAGAAVGAYAARAGLPCVMFTTRKFPEAMKVQMAVYGTKLLAAPSIEARWRLVEQGVDRLGWFPIPVFINPPIGSTCYGVEGYKTLAYEIIDQLGSVPDCVVAPVGAGDAFFGMWKGFTEYRDQGWTDRVPKMLAAEVFGPLEDALKRGSEQLLPQPTGPTPAISVGVSTATYQALHVLRETRGTAHSPTTAEMLESQRQLAVHEGIWAEVSSALALAAVPAFLERGDIQTDDTVVVLLTSSGLKDPGASLPLLPDLPSCEDDFDSALQVLRDVYGFSPPS
ncbi:MAG: pyridoxal-phosphate dependent enzyme [Candidatus Dormiibacterota bacterium]